MERAILAIETSTRQGSVALWGDGQVLFEQSFYADRSHNSAVFGPLVEVLGMVGEAGLSQVVAGTGPGSYTGARVGIAAGQGVAMVRGVEFVGLASVCSADVAADDYAVVGDARRGLFFWAEVRTRALVGEVEVLLGREAFEEKVRGSRLATFTFDEGLEGVERARPVAGKLAEAAAMAGVGRGWAQVVEPLYLGVPFVTTPKRRGIG